MAGTIDMQYTQQFASATKFFADLPDGSRQEVAVDAVRWSLSDPMGGTFEQVGNDCSFKADKAHAADTAARTAILSIEVDENGVANAITDSWEVVVHGPQTPAATSMDAGFTVSEQP